MECGYSLQRRENEYMLRQSDPPQMGTIDADYTARLLKSESVWWKKLLDVQRPYCWNIRRLSPGFTLDLGCGLGRNLLHLRGNGVGIDHSPHSVEIARLRGLRAFTPDEFVSSEFNVPERFDSILLSHVAEHMSEREAAALLTDHIYLLRPGGVAILICPQEAGYRSDPTHVQFMDFASLRRICAQSGLTSVRQYSFPFPRPVGRFFKYNEFVCICMKTPRSDRATEVMADV